jgi:hypothetical protein
MTQAVEITFDCVPLRSLGRLDVPLDATPEEQAIGRKIQAAAKKHGLFNSFYLCNARCVFHLTNHAEVGMIEFRFEGTVLTDQDDQKTIGCDLQVELEKENCPWLNSLAVGWLKDTVIEAVKIEFDRYIKAGDLQKTIRRIELLQAETEAHGGYMGMGL